MIARLYLVWCLGAALALAVAGCNSLDRQPESVEESLFLTTVYGRSLTLLVNDAYVSGAITKEQQLSSLDTLQDAKNLADSTLTIYQAGGSVGDATLALDRIESYLRVVALLLNQYYPVEEQ